ncbi:uncharacterized protein LOC110064812 [Orbicella faveolata]|uniref:uncharacterized protein LOC110064812 n=1 Tax=Orbicella faveolata TaxID=48498 RepID=UPI0009E24EAF|nr:uncharacterized protein LOC110064812 [Orbicella faveolata]
MAPDPGKGVGAWTRVSEDVDLTLNIIWSWEKLEQLDSRLRLLQNSIEPTTINWIDSLGHSVEVGGDLTVPDDTLAYNGFKMERLLETFQTCYPAITTSLKQESCTTMLNTGILVPYHLVKLGYFLGLQKSILEPRKVFPYSGFLADSARQLFHLKPDKKQKFLELLQGILGSKRVSMKTLQRLVGKCNSFSLAVPATGLFIRPIPWRDEHYVTISIATYASGTGWGGVLSLPSHDEKFDGARFECHERFTRTTSVALYAAAFSRVAGGKPLHARPITSWYRNETAVCCPPKTLTGPFIKFLEIFKQSCTVVVMDVFPKKFWWPIMENMASKKKRLEVRGDRHALLVPSKKGWCRHPGIHGVLWAFAITLI